MNKVTSYLKNTSKSFAYATVDVSKKLMPEVSEFVDTNAEILKSIYATVSHSKRAIKYGKKLAIESQVYKDINKGINNVLSDIKTGNFYNQERQQAAYDSAADFMIGRDDDFGDFGDFDDFGDLDNFDDGSLDDFTDKPSKSASVDKGDLAIVESVSKSSNLSAQLISKTVANTSKAIMNTSVATTNMMIAQNAELMAGLRTSISGVHQSINSLLSFAQENITTQINNEAAYFSRSQELLEDNNKILREMLEIQKNMYKTPEQSKSSDQFGSIFSGSTIDLKEYFKVIGKNIKALDKTGTVDMMLGTMGDGTMLGQMLTNPLGSLVTGLVAGFMPKNLAKSIANFSKTLGGFFPAMLSKMNRWKEKDGLLGLLGKVLGIKSDTKKTIDTGNYNKGAVPFDGITRKAIVDVIPEHLSKIESLLSGQSQRTYDYSTGKWMDTFDIQRKQQEEYQRFINDSFSDTNDTIKAFRNSIIKTKALSYDELKKLDDDIMKMKTFVFEKGGGHFSPKQLKKDFHNSNDMKLDSKEELIDALLDALGAGPVSNLMSVSSKIFENKKRYADNLRNAEINGDSFLRKLFDNSGINSHLLFDEKFKDQVVGMKTNNGLLGAKDSLGNNVLDYLKDITINLSYIRAGGASSGSTMSFDDYKKSYEKSHVPENIAKRQEKEDKERESYNKRNYDDEIDSESAATVSRIEAVNKTKDSNLDKDELEPFGKFVKNKRNKHEKIMDEIPGKTFGEKFKNAKSFKERYSLLLGSMHKAAKKPTIMLENLINKANESIYHLLFEAEFDEIYDDEESPGQKVKGLFGKALNQMQSAWTLMTQTLTEKVIDPLAEKFGLKEKWDKFKEKMGNTSIAQKFREVKSGISQSLRGNVTGIKNYTINSLKEVASPLINDPVIARFRMGINDAIIGKSKKVIDNLSYEDAIEIKKYLNSPEGKEEKVPKDILRKIDEVIEAGPNSIETAARGGIFKGPNGTRIVVANENEDIFVANRDFKNTEKNAKKENIVASKLRSLLGKRIGIDTKDTGGVSEGKGLLDKLLNANHKASELKNANDNIKANMNENGPISTMVDAGAQEIENIGKFVKAKTISDEDSKKLSQNKDSIIKKIGNIFGEMKGSGYDAAAKAIIGGGLGLFSGIVGGPLLGAAIGAGTSIIKNSSTVQKFLFGEQTIDEKTGEVIEKKGLISKNIQDTFKKYVPDMGKYGITGAVSSLFLPFGPLTGAAIGAGISIVKNSETMNEMIFGEENGLINKDRKEKIKKALPAATAGAIGGLFLGPFGMLGNAALGAGVGLLTQTEEFKNLIFGEEDENGERFGGLKGSLDEYFIDPLRNFATDFKDNFFAMIKENMIDPLNNAITPLTKEVGHIVKGIAFFIPKAIAKIAEDKIGAPIAAAIKDKLVDPILGFSRGILKTITKGARNMLFAPFKVVGGLGNIARRRQIKRGDATYMGAEERIQFMNGKSYDLREQDEALMGMTDEQIQNALGLVQGTVNGVNYFDRQIKKTNRDLSNRISQRFKEGHITGGNAGKIRRALNDGDIQGAMDLLYNLKSRGKIKGEDFDTYAEDIRRVALKNKALKEQKQNINKFLNGDGEIDESGIMTELNKLGIKVENKQDLKRLLNNLKGENKYRKNYKGDLTTKEMRENLTNDGAVISSWLEKIYNKINGIEESAKNGGTEGLTDSQIRNLNLQEKLSGVEINKNINKRNNKLKDRKLLLTGLGIEVSILSNENIEKAILDNDIFQIIKKAAEKGVKLNEEQIINLTKFNKDIIKELKKRPELSILDPKSINRYLGNSVLTKGTFNTRFNKNILSQALNSGVDLGSAKNINDFMGSSSTKKGKNTRLEYFNKFKRAGLLDKYGQSFIWTANFEDLDMILKNYEVNKSKNVAEDILNSDDSKLNSSNNDVETVFTENGIINYVKDGRGAWDMANDKETKETLKNKELELSSKNSLMDTMTNNISNIKDNILGLFNHQKEKDEEEQKEPWYKKLFDFDLSKITGKLKFGGALLGMLTGIGALKGLWDKDGDSGPLHTIVNTIKEKVEGPLTTIKNWFTNSGEFENKGGLQGFLNDHVFPNLFTGMNVIFQYVVPAILKAFIVNIPTMVKAGISGIGQLLGIGDNKHKNDNKIDANSIKGATSGASLGKFTNGTIKSNSSWFSKIVSQSKEVSKTTIDEANNAANAVSGSSGRDYFDTDDITISDESTSTSESNNTENTSSNYSRNNHRDIDYDSKTDGTKSTLKNSEQATIGEYNLRMFKKNKKGELVPITIKEAKNGKINDFYTETGAHYVYNSKTNDFESTEEDKTSKETLITRLTRKVIPRSIATGKTMGIMRLFDNKAGRSVLEGANNILSKIPGGKFLSGAFKGIGNISKGSADFGQTAKAAIDLMAETGDIKGSLQAANPFLSVKNNVLNSKTGKLISKAVSKISPELTKFTNFLKSALNGIFDNSVVLNKIKDTLKAAGSKKTTVTKVISEIKEKLLAKFAAISTKLGSSTITKLAAKAASFATVVIPIALAVKDFVVGFDQAESILGIKEVNIVQRLIAAVINAINNQVFFGLIDTHTIVNWCVDIIFPIFNINMEEFEKERAETEEEVKQYNALNGTNYDTEEYLKKDKFTYKISKGLGNIKENAKGAVSWVQDKAGKAISLGKEKASQAGSWVQDKAGKAISWGKEAYNGIKKGIGIAGDQIKEFGSWAGKKIDIAKELSSYAFTVTKDVFRDAFAGKNVETEGVKVDKDDPLYDVKHTIYQLEKIIGTFTTIPIKIGRSIYDFIKPAIDAVKDIGSGVGKAISGMFTKAWNGDIKNLFTIEKADTGNGFVDTTTDLLNSVSKIPLSIPAVLTSGIGFVVKHFNEIVGSVKAVGSGIGSTVKGIFTNAWNGDIAEAFKTNESSKTGNDFIDGISNVINNTIKLPLFVPTILTSGVGFAVRHFNDAVNAIKAVGNGIKASVSSMFTKAWNGDIKNLFTIEKSNTGNGFVDTTTDLINNVLKAPLAVPAILTSGAGFIVRKLQNFVESIKDVSKLSSKDQQIIDKSKDGDIIPLTSEYWTIDNKYTGFKGILYWFNSAIQKVLNLPNALLGMISFKNISKLVDLAADKLGISDDEFEGEGSKKKKKSGRGSGKEKGFISQLDPRYRNIRFNKAGDTETQTLGDSGCGPATAANVINLFSGQGSTMEDASRAALRYKDKNGGVTPDYFENYLGQNGIDTYSTMNKKEIANSISSGNPTILLGSDPSNKSNTPYGSASSHYVLATGMDGNGNAIVQDPESRHPNSLYPMKDLVNQSQLAMTTNKKSGFGSGKISQYKASLRSRFNKLGFGKGDPRNRDLAVWSPITAEEMQSVLDRYYGGGQAFRGKAQVFINAGKASGLDPRYLIAHAAGETGWGTTGFASVYNFYGIGVFNSNPSFGYKYTNKSFADGVINGARWIRGNYYNKGMKSLISMIDGSGGKRYCMNDDGSINYAWLKMVTSIMESFPRNGKETKHKGDDKVKLFTEGTPEYVYGTNSTNYSGGESDDGSYSDNSSSTTGGIFDQLADLPKAYFGEELINLIFGGSDSSSSSDYSDSDDYDDSDDGSSEGSSLGSGVAKQFHDKYYGKKVDVDGAYGSQCVDLFSRFKIDHVDGKPSWGNAKDLYGTYGNTSGYKKVPLSQGRYGDWIIWGPSQGGGYGHVGMFLKRQGNGYVYTFGTNQGASANLTTGGPANDMNISESGILGLLRPVINSGKGSGKNKIDEYLKMVDPSKPTRMVKMPGSKTRVPFVAQNAPNTYTTIGTKYESPFIRNLDNNMLSGKGSLPKLSTPKHAPQLGAAGNNSISVSANKSSNVDKLINVIIEILSIIAGNTSKLSDIVTLLSKALGLELSDKDISSLSSNNAQIKNKLANALKAQGSVNGLGDSIMNADTESLATALYTIARA